MHPELFRIGPVTVYTYGALVALGIALAAFLATRRASTIQLNAVSAFDLVVWTGLVGIVGGRFAYIGENFTYFLSNPSEALRLWQGGLVFHGGIIASLLYVFFFARRRQKNFLAVLDFLIPYVALAYAVGRIGCFFNGCCYGIPFNGVWAVVYPVLGEPQHPTQIYSSAAGFLLFWFLLRLDQLKSFQGQTSAAYFILYSAARIAIEFYRGDKPHDVFGFLTSAQLIFFAVFLIALFLYAVLRLQNRK